MDEANVLLYYTIVDSLLFKVVFPRVPRGVPPEINNTCCRLGAELLRLEKAYIPVPRLRCPDANVKAWDEVPLGANDTWLIMFLVKSSAEDIYRPLTFTVG